MLKILRGSVVVFALLCGGTFASAQTYPAGPNISTAATSQNNNQTVNSAWVKLQGYVVGTAAVITGGTIDGTVIGGTTPAAGSFTTLGATGASSLTGGVSSVNGTSAPAGGMTTNVLTSSSSSNQLVVKNGPNGSNMILFGGSNADIEPQVPIKIPGTAWAGTGSDEAPFILTGTYTGTSTSAKDAFVLYGSITDNSSCSGGSTGACDGIFLDLILGGSTVGHRSGILGQIDINAATGNTAGFQYTGVIGKCNIAANDAPGATPPGATCFGVNSVAHVKANYTADQIIGNESDTWAEAGSVMTDRVGFQVVDVAGTTYGQQATRDDVAFSMNAQYGACYFTSTGSSISGTTLTIGTVTAGAPGTGCLITGTNVTTPTNITANISGSGNGSTWTVASSQTAASGSINGISGMQYGVEFGRAGGNFGISPLGTMVYAQGNAGAAVSVANGIDWHLVTFSGNAYNDGHVTISGAGTVSAVAYKAGSTAGVTCSGSPTASFASSNGIVTHC